MPRTKSNQSFLAQLAPELYKEAFCDTSNKSCNPCPSLVPTRSLSHCPPGVFEKGLSLLRHGYKRSQEELAKPMSCNRRHFFKECFKYYYWTITSIDSSFVSNSKSLSRSTLSWFFDLRISVMAIFSANSIPSNAKFLWGTMCLVWRGIVSLTLKTSLSPCRNLLLNIKYIMELIAAFVWEIQKKRSGTGARRTQYFERLRTLIKWFTWAKANRRKTEQRWKLTI